MVDADQDLCILDSFGRKKFLRFVLNRGKEWPKLKSMQIYEGNQILDIDYTYLYKMCQENSVYIDFADYHLGTNPVTQYSMEKYICLTTEWTKYKNLFDNFVQWCQANLWWYDCRKISKHMYPRFFWKKEIFEIMLNRGKEWPKLKKEAL